MEFDVDKKKKVLDGITYLCFATKGHKTGVCFGFLDEISKKFTSTFEKNQMMVAHAYDARYAGFERTLESEMERFSHLTSVDKKLENIHSSIEQTRGIMVDNINKVIERGDNIDNLLLKTDILVTDSETFKVSAVKVKRKMWWRNMTLWIVLAIVAIVSIFFPFFLPFSLPFYDLSNLSFLTLSSSNKLQILIWLVFSVACGFDFSCLHHNTRS